MSDLEKQIQASNKEEIERQLERLGFFAFNGFTSHADRINEVEALLYGLINTLLVDQTINREKLNQIAASVKQDMMIKGEQLIPGVTFSFDGGGDSKPGPPVNCEDRLHICKAVCCKLSFALSQEEIEKGKIKWDLGIPYRIRQTQEGYCTHIKEDKCCGIYEDRPGVCHRYSCVNDQRIWKDFEKMELNEEWISTNIKKKTIQFEKPQMIHEMQAPTKNK